MFCRKLQFQFQIDQFHLFLNHQFQFRNWTDPMPVSEAINCNLMYTPFTGYNIKNKYPYSRIYIKLYLLFYGSQDLCLQGFQGYHGVQYLDVIYGMFKYLKWKQTDIIYYLDVWRKPPNIYIYIKKTVCINIFDEYLMIIIKYR